MLSCIQQCKEWRGYQGHRYLQQTQELAGNTMLPNSVVPARWHHKAYCINVHGEAALNVSASSNLMIL
jgi:hypothetical protein